jgi:hypothetical protein
MHALEGMHRATSEGLCMAEDKYKKKCSLP